MIKESQTKGAQHRGFAEPGTYRVRSSSNTATFNRQDDVEAVLSQAQDLIGRAMSSHRGNEHHVRQLPGDDIAFQSMTDEMIKRAQRELLCVLPAGDFSRGHRDHTVHLLHGAHQRGVHVAALVPSSATASLVGTVRAMGDRAGYRAGDFPDQHLVIADGLQAALRTPGQNEPAQTLIVSAPPFVHFLRTMFGVNWNSAAPLVEMFHVNERLRTQLVQSILASLGAGTKDEVAARKLGLSVRTYRRYIAEIMQDMRATSRFQAGVRAAELGLL
jgi:hypothetical protein